MAGTGSAKPTGNKIFISYRREDAADNAGRIRDWFVGFEHVPPQDIFMDVNSIQIGADFLQALEGAIKQSRAMLVVMGPNWFVRDKTLSLRVHDEVRLALQRKLQIIPVLVRGASMPEADDLPEDIRKLAFLNACEVRAKDFEYDMRRLADAIVPQLQQPILPDWRFWVSWIAGLVVAISVFSQVPVGNPVYTVFHAGGQTAIPTKTVTVSPTNSVTAHGPPYTETAGADAHTWTDYTSAGGTEGQLVPRGSTIQVTCRIEGFQVEDKNTWWYRIASSPWDNKYYVSADAIYNNGATSGSLLNTPWVDTNVPMC